MPDFTYQNTLIVFALKVEAQKSFDEFEPLFTGCGKVNAAYKLTRSLAEWQHSRGKNPELVLNIGSAGSTKFKTGSIVNCTRFIQRDFDVTALGHEAFLTPYENIPVSLASGLRFPDFVEGTCGTGDNFATSGALSSWDVVDMEAYALAKICYFETIPFACLKYITDGADGAAAQSWQEGLADTAKQLRIALDKLLGR